MIKRFDLIVFDWDGTVVDSANSIACSLQGAARDLGVPEPSNEEARYVIGLGLNEAIRHLFPSLSSQKLNVISDSLPASLSYTGQENIAL